MRSGTSFFDWTVFKKTICRFWPLWGAYSAVWLVFLPLQGLMMLRLDAQDKLANYLRSFSHMTNFAQYAVSEMTGLSLALSVAFGALCAMAVCSHLYNARSANFFGALPVRREGLFLTHYLAGLAFLLVPNVVIFLLTLLVEAAGGCVFLPGLGFWLAVTCGECLFFYSMAVFCGMFTGHILALPAFYGIFNILVYGMFGLVSVVFRSFYYGFERFGPWVEQLAEWCTPVMKLNSEVQGYIRWVATGPAGSSQGVMEPRGLGVVAAYAAAAVVLAAASFFLYRARPMESAGDVVSVKCMRPVFKYGVALCAGLALGITTASIVYLHDLGLMAAILVWGVIGYFVAQMLLDKSFRVFKKWKGGLATAGAFVLLFLVMGFDLTGFETRVPSPDQVDYVEFRGADMHYLGDDGDYLSVEESGPEFVEYAILLHQAAVDQKRYEFQPNGTTQGSSLRLTYHLKSGSTLSRRYPLYVDASEVDQEGSAAWVVQQIYGDRDLYWRAYGFETAEKRVAEEGWRLQEVSYENDKHDPGTDQTVYYGGTQARELYEAVKEDFRAGRIGVRRVEDWKESAFDRHNLQFQFSDGADTNCWIDIRVQDTASSTLAVLERLEQEGIGQGYGTWTTAGGELPEGMEHVDGPEVLEDGTVVAYPTVSAGPEPIA